MTAPSPGDGKRAPSGRRDAHPAGPASALIAAPMLAVLGVPLIALTLSSSPADVATGLGSPLFGPALWLSARTTATSLLVVVATGTPLAWWIATHRGRAARLVSAIVDLPIVIPPAVIGIALLETFGPTTILGPAWTALGIRIPFTSAAVVVAQVVVSAPFYVQTAANALGRVDDDLLVVARTLGQSPAGAFLRVALPLALPGIVQGAALAWARALGEFGATLLFAGNLPGTTQTMPLAIYAALESDVRVAAALALILAAASVLPLTALRAAPALLARRRS